MSSTTTSPSNFRSIFDAALSDYAKQFHVDLTNHPFTQTLQTCDSVEAILALFHDKANKFQAYRNGNRKLINRLKPVVEFLHTVSGVLCEAAILVPSQPKAVLVGVDILLTASIAVSASYDALVDLFERVGSFLNRLRIYDEIRLSPSMYGIITKIMAEVLSVLSLATKQIKKGRLRKFMGKLFGETKIEDALHRLDRLTQDETRMTGTETLQEVRRLGTDISRIVGAVHDIQQPPATMPEETKKINKMEPLHFQKEIRSWLSPPDPSTNHNSARDTRLDGTTEWFTQGSTFETWNATGSLLWIHGKAGSGKSVICSSIIQQVETKCDPRLAMMGYYYFDFKDPEKQGIRGFLTSLLFQFCTKFDPCDEVLYNLYLENAAGSRQPNNEALARSLMEIIRLPQAPMRYIILDGIDECPNTSGFPTAREEVLKFLNDLVDLNLSNLRICVTSRPEVDIRTALEPLTSLLVPLQDQIGQKQAILDYIRSIVYSNPRMEIWKPEDKQLVIGTLSAKADGMWRWVYCQLDTLRRCHPDDIRHALDELPKSLYETYERTLLRIEEEKREYAQRLFQCLAVAVRPLRLDELAEVFAIRFDSGQLPPRYHADWQLKVAQDLVQSACSSLISVVDVDGSPVVQFVHFSVKEFLMSDRLANSRKDLSRFHIHPHSAHTILAKASLTLLLHLGDRVDKNSIKNFPFAQYAARHWVDHVQFEDVSLTIQDAMQRLFNIDEPSFATWIWIYDIDYPYRPPMFEDRPPLPEAVPLYYAAFCGFRNLVEHLISDYPGDIGAIGGNHGSAVNAALVKGHMAIALLLLKHGADTNTFDTRNDTPLCIASRRGCRDIVELLLEHQANTNLANFDTGDTPLKLAVCEGELDIAKVLLCHGATIDTPSKDGWTPLKSASRYGHLDAVRLLIQNGAAVNFPDKNGCTPLDVASQYGHLDIVQFLLQSGAVVDIQDKNGWTALNTASRFGRLHVARELLYRGAAIDAQTDDLWTPLHLSSANGHLGIVDLLIERHADLQKQNKDLQTPLDLAAASGKLDVACFLIESGSSLNSQDSNGSTPLHTAAYHGHLNIVKLLLESGADVDPQNHKNQTPLDVASSVGNREVAQCLANHMGVSNPLDGMDVALFEKTENMSPGATSSSAGILKPTNNPKPGRHLNTSLHDASAEGNIEIVQSLLDHGADVNQRNEHHRTALYIASKNGKLEAAKLLIKYGTDVNCHEKFGWTPLHLASRYGHRDIAELLLEHGADVDARQQTLSTPLHLASWNGYPDIVTLLLKKGADVHARNVEGRTPYVLASRRGEQGIKEVLFGKMRAEG